MNHTKDSIIRALDRLRRVGEPDPALLHQVEGQLMETMKKRGRIAGPLRFGVGGLVLAALAGAGTAGVGIAAYNYYWTVEEIPIDETTSQYRLTHEETGETHTTEPLPNDTEFFEIEGSDGAPIGVRPVGDGAEDKESD